MIRNFVGYQPKRRRDSSSSILCHAIGKHGVVGCMHTGSESAHGEKLTRREEIKEVGQAVKKRLPRGLAGIPSGADYLIGRGNGEGLKALLAFV
jgi:hypothetical protein